MRRLILVCITEEQLGAEVFHSTLGKPAWSRLVPGPAVAQNTPHWRQGDTEQARIAFQTVVAQYPNTSHAEEAEGNLREIKFLNVGQPAPQFDRTTINGDPLSLASFKGKVVVLKFWGTY